MFKLKLLIHQMLTKYNTSDSKISYLGSCIWLVLQIDFYQSIQY